MDLRGRRVLMRVDFNVPMEDGRVLDESRIRAALPTLEHLRSQGASVVLMSHLGRPKGRPVAGLSLRPVADVLSRLIGADVLFVPDCLGPEAEKSTGALAPGQAALLENVRFYPGDEANDPAMASALARHGDVYVNDAFGAAHRAHASTSGVAAHLPSYAGLLMQRELAMLGGLLSKPARPFLVVLGGAKVSDKLPVIAALLQRCDVLALGGGMANTFLAATGLQLGRSLVETDIIGVARDLLAQASAGGVRVILPSDLVVAGGKDAAPGETATVAADQVPPEMAAFDLGPRSAAAIGAASAGAATIFWNGTVGVYESPAFAAATAAVALSIAEATSRGAVSVAAGGDSLAAVCGLGLEARFTHLSTGGGAALELLEGRSLPGVECLLSRGDADGPRRRVPVVAGNWKMHKTAGEARALVRALLDRLAAGGGVRGGEALVCPPYPLLPAVSDELAVRSAQGAVGLGAQNMHWQASGAFTGEVSAPMLIDAGCRAVIIGHSERRTYFGETDDSVNRKASAALGAGLMPIVCVGETEEQRRAGRTSEVLTGQVRAAVAGLGGGDWAEKLVFAYEPVWAIGTGAAASPEDAVSAALTIRGCLPAAAASRVRVLYGGSVKSSNVDRFMGQPDIDGVLVGGASLDGMEFGSLVLAGLAARAHER